MGLAIVLFIGLFGYDNADFFNAVEENNKKGYTIWQPQNKSRNL